MKPPETHTAGDGWPAYHVPVLCDEVISFLLTDREGLYIDGTTGGGGHAERLCGLLEGRGELVCMDADDEALAEARLKLSACQRVHFVQANFRMLRSQVEAVSPRSPSGLLLDLGVSSHQLDTATRGFSFRGDAPLDMRFDRRQSFSALDVVNSYDEARLAEILFRFGEERASRAIARKILAARPMRTTGELADAVEGAVGQRFLLKSLARVFQAVRIEVNQELDALRETLQDAAAMLAAGGRIVVIAYHSLEDRVVKETFRRLSATSIPSGNKLVPDQTVRPILRTLTRHPVLPSSGEARSNPRARSAKLRVAERLP
jgi:16S rRNA (cytosine1402-N4)-methyltransferase